VMKTVKQFLFVAFVTVLSVSVTMADEKAGPTATPGPAVVYQAKYPIMVKGAEYDLLTIIMDFPSGAGVPRHIHGGSVLATVLSGEITLKEKGADIIKKTGESWTEKPGAEHAVVNAGTATVRVAVSMLLPKGSEATTIVK
jgi:quercetin dioxygenase-like cupin family protein